MIVMKVSAHSFSLERILKVESTPGYSSKKIFTALWSCTKRVVYNDFKC